MMEWDYDRNNELEFFPEKISIGSNKKVWWKCKHGHSYDMRITQRMRGQGCPFCSNRRVLKGFNDLASSHPEIMEQWDFEKNAISPHTITYGSHENIWWKCSVGHSFQMPVNKKISRNSICPVCSGHLTIPGINDFATHYPQYAAEWHPTKNGTLKPSEISQKNGRHVWWLCKYGHEWEATPKDRVIDNTGCPYCSARRNTSFPEQAIFFYIKKLYPDAVSRYRDIFDNGMELDIYVPTIRLAIEFDGGTWHNSEDSHRREKQKYDICRNNDIKLIRIKERIDDKWDDVADVVYTIEKRRYYQELQPVIQVILETIDEKCSIDVDLRRDENEIKEYLTPINNSLSVLRPDLVEEWNYEKNGKLTPNLFGTNSNDYVWWKCKICGHEWHTTIIHRGGKRNSGCPECAKIKKGKTFTKKQVAEKGSLADNSPELVEEWHPTNNHDLRPCDITSKSNKKIWWVCKICNHEWETTPNNRVVKGSGCPACSGRVPRIGENDLKTLFPELLNEWNYEKNIDIKPETFLPKSGKKVWWKCKRCGHEWEATIGSRTNGHGCPRCNRKKQR